MHVYFKIRNLGCRTQMSKVDDWNRKLLMIKVSSEKAFFPVYSLGMKWSYAWSYICFRLLLLINYILLQKQQFKPKHLAHILFGPVFRKSFAWMTIGVISLHSTQTLFLDYYKEYLGRNTNKGAKPFIPLPQHIQDIISEVRMIELCHYRKTVLNIMPFLKNIFMTLVY